MNNKTVFILMGIVLLGSLLNRDIFWNTAFITGKSAEKNKPITYLPPSIIKAKLLTGCNFELPKSNLSPLPVMLLITEEAKMPNDNKSSDLVGCFVVAEAIGELTTGRAKLRLANITCVDNEKKTTIDAPVKGYIVGNDNNVGIPGDVKTSGDSAFLMIKPQDVQIVISEGAPLFAADNTKH